MLVALNGGSMPDTHTLLAVRAVADDLRQLPADVVDAELSVAIDALLLAGRMGSGLRVCAAAVWVAYRVGVIVGRRRAGL